MYNFWSGIESKVILLLGFTLSIYFLMNFSSMFMFWMLLEVNMLMFIMLTLGWDKYTNNPSGFGLDYFMIQSMGSLMVLYVSLSSSFSVDILEMFIVISLVLKMGLFPFHSWVYSLSWMISWLPFIFMISLQKIPLTIFSAYLDSEFVLTLFMISMGFGSIKILSSLSLKEMLVSSSIYFSLWFFLFFYFSKFMGVIFTALYFVSLYCLKFYQPLMSSSMYSLLVFFLIGLPPMIPFLCKFIMVGYVTSYHGFFMFFLVWIFLVFSLMGYLKIFFSFFRDRALNIFLVPNNLIKPLALTCGLSGCVVLFI